LSGTIVIGGVGAAVAYQNGHPTTIAAFDYSYLVFGLAWGIIFFSEFPNWISLSGIVLIIAAGFLALFGAAQAS
jgi:drug/metabolite transporter (DMT)-like permease